MAAKRISAASAVKSAPKQYSTIGDVMRAAAKGALPRGAMFVIGDGGVELRARIHGVVETLYSGKADDAARWGLRKAGLKAEFVVK
jgi:hypothetical protein